MNSISQHVALSKSRFHVFHVVFMFSRFCLEFVFTLRHKANLGFSQNLLLAKHLYVLSKHIDSSIHLLYLGLELVAH